MELLGHKAVVDRSAARTRDKGRDHDREIIEHRIGRARVNACATKPVTAEAKPGMASAMLLRGLAQGGAAFFEGAADRIGIVFAALALKHHKVILIVARQGVEQ